MPSEADTCRTLNTPKLQAAGWEQDPHSIAEQRFFTDGRIVVRKHLPDALKIRSIFDHGSLNEIIGKFSGAEQIRMAVEQLQSLLYAT